MSLSVQMILEYISSLNPTGKLGGEEGLLYGRNNADVSGISLAGIELIVHEWQNPVMKPE